MNIKDLWLRILTEISLQISRSFFITYFKNSAILGIWDDWIMVIWVPRPMYLNWHLEHTKDKLLEISKKINPNIKNLVFKVDGTLENDNIRTVNIIDHFKDKKVKKRKLPNKQEVRMADGVTSKILNPKYSLDNFVIGSNNQLAHAAASAVAAHPGGKYNPLFIYWGVGLGKTHLLQAIWNEVVKNDANKVIVYITSETFTNELVMAMQKRKMDQFRKRYRNIDVLIIDDIQFFAGKDKTQEEFFHTFNTLHEAGKQVIISSDRPPKELNWIEERMKSRCEWGMIVDVKMPDFETRLAILYEKAKDYQSLISAEIFEFIAFNVHHSIRELEWILNQVVAILELQKKSPELADVAEIIKRLNKDVQLKWFEDKPVLVKDMQWIVEFVSDYYNVTVSEILWHKRAREFMLPRQVSMYICKTVLKLPLKQIWKFFDGRDHTSVMHSVKKLDGDFKKDTILKRDIENLKKEMGI